MTEQSPLELGETKQEPAYIVLQHANYMERELGRLWLNGDDAKEKAAFIVRAGNCHKELVEALEDAIKLINDMNGCHGCADNSADEDNSRRNAVAAALAKAKEGTVDESQMLLQDLDEETL